MELMKEINLNINQPNNFELIHIMQGSVNSVRIIAHLYDGNQPYQIPDTVSEYQLLGILPSGKYLIDDKVTKYDANSVSFLINKNLMAKAGYIPFSISLVEDGDTAIAETFPAKIMVAAIPGQDYEQTDEIPIITESLQKVKRNAESAAQSAQEAKTSETNAKACEINAGTSEQNAKTYADNAKSSETNAKQSEINAMSSETNASNSMSAAATSDDNAAKSAVNASASAATAATKATEASDFAIHSKSYAVGGTDTRENEDIDNAKFYYEQSKAISESLSGTLRPMGTVTFANLPSLEDAASGDMYNIADQFTTDENFKEGSGLTISAGSNIYKTADGKWDVLAGCPVTGVKGNSESTYRKGNVNITPADIGLGNVGNFKAVSTAASQGLSDAEKANARSNINAVNKAGDTMTGNLVVSHNSSPSVTIKNPNSSDVALIFDRNTGANWRLLNSGGYLNFQNDWPDGKKGNYTTKMRLGSGTGNFELYNTNQPQIMVIRTDSDGNTLRSGMLQVSSGNNLGIWDITNKKWMCYSNASGAARFVGCADETDYINPHIIPSNADLQSETYQKPGFYYCPANATVATLKNCPTSNAFLMVVGKHAGVYQEITEFLPSGQKRYMRNLYKTTWGTWYRIYTEANKPTASEIGALPVNGNASSATKATQDGNGKVIASTYLPLSGGTMTGTLYMDTSRKSYIYGSAQKLIMALDGNFTNQTGAATSARLEVCERSVIGTGLVASSAGTNTTTITLGTSNDRWGQIYSTTSVISTSDRNLKDHIKPLNTKYLDFIKLLTPVSFTFKDGESGRTHIGFISQDVESAMEQAGLTSLDFAGFCKDQVTQEVPDPDNDGMTKQVPVLDEDGQAQYVYSLRYEEFIALNTAMIQHLDNRADVLERKYEALEKRMEILENLLTR